MSTEEFADGFLNDAALWLARQVGLESQDAAAAAEVVASGLRWAATKLGLFD